MQRSLRSLLSGKVKYYVGKLSVALILLSMKLQETFGHVPLEDRTKDALETIYMPACQPGTTIGNFTRLRQWMFRRKLNFLFFRVPKDLSIRVSYENP